jgi:hypothetical protein
MQVLQIFDGRGERMGRTGFVEASMLLLAAAAAAAVAVEDWFQSLTQLLLDLQEIYRRCWDYD